MLYLPFFYLYFGGNRSSQHTQNLLLGSAFDADCTFFLGKPSCVFIEFDEVTRSR